jgi:hypothetical protein
MNIGELKGILQKHEATELQKKYATLGLRAYANTLKKWAERGETGRHIELLGECYADNIWSGLEKLVTKKAEDGTEYDEIITESDPEAPGYRYVDSRPSNPTNLETKVNGHERHE